MRYELYSIYPFLGKPPNCQNVGPGWTEINAHAACSAEHRRFVLGMDRILSLTTIPTIVLDPENTILEASRGFYDVTGLTRSECVNCKLPKLLNPRKLFVDIKSILSDIAPAVCKGKPVVCEEVLEVNKRHWQKRICPIFEDTGELLYIVVDFEDVTDEFHKLQALRDQMQESGAYRLLVNTVKEYAIFQLDSKGYITTWNTGAGLLKQYSESEIIGKHFSIFYSQEDIDAGVPDMELAVAVQEGKFEDTGWRYRKDGSRFWANILITPSYQNDIPVGFTKVTRDLTERHDAEQFIANLSHEIRTPMHSMLSAAMLLTETGLNEEQQELAEIVQDSGSILLQAVDDILDYSKLSSGAFKINIINMSVKDTVDTVVRSSDLTLKPDLQIHTIIDPNVPEMLNGDPLRLRQVLQNLVVNAIKFTEIGYVEIKVSVIKERGSLIEVMTEVTDTGVGVPTQSVPSLFTPFTQLDNAATRKHKGTGLGLSICKSLVKLMGGNIGFRPNPARRGSCFWFTVAMTKAESKQKSRNHFADESALSLIKTMTGKRLLLIEDNPVNLKVMIKTFARLGFMDVEVADDGQQGIDKFRADKYDLIFMDISMPRKDGITATQEIRREDDRIPIIAMTANALKGDVERFIAAGMSDFIAKPVDRRQLINVLVKWLS